MSDYGIPYLGSKATIIHKIAAILPPADNFYDLFGGGFAVSHYLIKHHANKYKNFYFNERDASITELIREAISGKFNYKRFKPEFITRERFEAEKETSAYIRCVWSFGNSQRRYLFGKDIEAYKKSLHNAVIFERFDSTAIDALGISKWPVNLSVRGKRFFIRKVVKERKGELRRLQQLEQLERLQRLQRLELTSLDYKCVNIKPNSVIYCDPPYKGTAQYRNNINHDEFWRWVREERNPVFISEYEAPKDIRVLLCFRTVSRLKSSGPLKRTVEKVFINKAAEDKLRM